MKYFSLFIILLFFSCQENTVEQVDNEDPEMTQAISVNDLPQQVKLGSLQQKEISRKVSCTGRLEVPPTSLISIHSPAAGFVETIKYIPGKYVPKGAKLLTIYNPSLIEKQRKMLETKASLSLAKNNYERRKTLQKEDATTQKALEEAKAEFELLSATYEGLKAELEGIGIHIEHLESNHQFQDRISIFAPVAAKIQDILVHKGEMIHPENPLMELVDNSDIHLELKVFSKDITHLRKGQQVYFTLPNSSRRYGAEIITLNPALDSETETLGLHCHIEHEHLKSLRPGMFVNAEIITQKAQVVGLPLEAIKKEGSSYFAYLADNSHLQKQELSNVQIFQDFVTFDSIPAKKVVVTGAYYLE